MSLSKAVTYAKSGVNIDAGDYFVELIKERVKAAWPSDNDEQIGGFAGQFNFRKASKKGKACADGSGTVAILCALTERWEVVGINAGAMSVVDGYVAGATPVGLIDVLDVATLDPDQHIRIIDGLITACKLAGPQCRLIGGETAELPDLFAQPWMINVNTFVVGEMRSNFSLPHVKPGQKVFAWPSNGFGSNGFSLIRKVFDLRGDYLNALRILECVHPDLGCQLMDAVLQPTPIWISELEAEVRRGVVFEGHAHITGGGLVENIPRILPSNVKVVLHRSQWKRPPVFGLLQRTGKIDEGEMNRVVNQGLMMVSILSDNSVAPQSEHCIEVGRVEARNGDESQVQFTGAFME